MVDRLDTISGRDILLLMMLLLFLEQECCFGYIKPTFQNSPQLKLQHATQMFIRKKKNMLDEGDALFILKLTEVRYSQ